MLVDVTPCGRRRGRGAAAWCRCPCRCCRAPASPTAGGRRPRAGSGSGPHTCAHTRPRSAHGPTPPSTTLRPSRIRRHSAGGPRPGRTRRWMSRAFILIRLLYCFQNMLVYDIFKFLLFFQFIGRFIFYQIFITLASIVKMYVRLYKCRGQL